MLGASSTLSLSLLGHLASQLLSQALFINQIKFIWPPAAVPPPTLPFPTPPPTAMLILCLSEGRRKKRRREGAEAARSRRCQLPISWAFFNILNCLAECVAPVPVPAQVPVPFPDPDPDPALGQHLSESSLPQIACCFYCLLLLLLFLLLVAVVAVAVFAAVSCAARASFIKKQLQCYGQFDARCSVLVPMGYRCVCVYAHTYVYSDLKLVYARRHHHQQKELTHLPKQ